MSATYVIPAAPQPAIAVAGDARKFPVRRIWCVGRNYLEHIRELGNDEDARDYLRMWWKERLRAARRVFNDPAQVEQIVAILEAAGEPGDVSPPE